MKRYKIVHHYDDLFNVVDVKTGETEYNGYVSDCYAFIKAQEYGLIVDEVPLIKK